MREQMHVRIVPMTGDHVDEVAEKFRIPVLGKMPIDPAVAANCDKGLVELNECPWLETAADAVEAAAPGRGRVNG